VRETPPQQQIHFIRNLYRAARCRATIFPLIPAYYYRPPGLDDMAREFAYRVPLTWAFLNPKPSNRKG